MRRKQIDAPTDYRIWHPSESDETERKDYPALRRKPYVPLRRGLLLLKRREGREALLDAERFRDALLSYGVSELETERAYLFILSGAARPLLSGGALDWAEMDRLIYALP